jgi:hypothetical protein
MTRCRRGRRWVPARAAARRAAAGLRRGGRRRWRSPQRPRGRRLPRRGGARCARRWLRRAAAPGSWRPSARPLLPRPCCRAACGSRRGARGASGGGWAGAKGCCRDDRRARWDPGGRPWVPRHAGGAAAASVRQGLLLAGQLRWPRPLKRARCLGGARRCGARLLLHGAGTQQAEAPSSGAGAQALRRQRRAAGAAPVGAAARRLSPGLCRTRRVRQAARCWRRQVGPCRCQLCESACEDRLSRPSASQACLAVQHGPHAHREARTAAAKGPASYL